mmetsp:Transcript_9431/g.9497  ORF Transcript_9431/g.9497 Transcript_9431/m.9497 type:complete len:358 (+) Transcript_9431:235-1308(+)
MRQLCNLRQAYLSVGLLLGSCRALIPHLVDLASTFRGAHHSSYRLMSSFTDKAASNAVKPGHVYFVATPVGNLGDMSKRAIDVLSSVDLICAEDTRHTVKLLRHFNIPMKPLVSHHEHNWSEKVPYLVSQALDGKSLAVVSDAGTPGISDPGRELAAGCAERCVPLHPVPGPSAVVAALSVSGFPGSHFTFMGFFAVKGSERKRQMTEAASHKHTVVFFEAPHRILSTLKELQQVHGMGSRPCVCCREITKLHEEFQRGTVSSCLDWLQSFKGEESEGERSVRGEFTVLLGPLNLQDGTEGGRSLESETELQEQTEQQLEELRTDGMRRSEAVKLVCEMTGLARGMVYKVALNMKWK